MVTKDSILKALFFESVPSLQRAEYVGYFFFIIYEFRILISTTAMNCYLILKYFRLRDILEQKIKAKLAQNQNAFAVVTRYIPERFYISTIIKYLGEYIAAFFAVIIFHNWPIIGAIALEICGDMPEYRPFFLGSGERPWFIAFQFTYHFPWVAAAFAFTLNILDHRLLYSPVGNLLFQVIPVLLLSTVIGTKSDAKKAFTWVRGSLKRMTIFTIGTVLRILTVLHLIPSQGIPLFIFWNYLRTSHYHRLKQFMLSVFPMELLVLMFWANVIMLIPAVFSFSEFWDLMNAFFGVL